MSEVKVNLSAKDEIALLDRYGRRCNRETLIKRALVEVLRQQADDVPVYVTIEEVTAKLNADAEAQRLADTEAFKLPPAVPDELAQRPVVDVELAEAEIPDAPSGGPNKDYCPLHQAAAKQKGLF